MPLFSIIIPTYNRAAFLGEAVDSVLAQSYTDYEVIVADDGSTDDTTQKMVRYGSKVRFLQQQNLGPGAARNLGAKHASGEYLAFLDSDDLWFPWTLESYRQTIEQCHQPAFIAGKPHLFRMDQEIAAARNGEIQVSRFSDHLASGDQWRWWGASSFVVRRDAFEKAGGFVNLWINTEDADLALRLGEAPGFVQITEPVTFGYREHEGSVMKNWEMTLAGIRQFIRAENEHEYPGGSQRAIERWQILTRHIRPMTLNCLKAGRRREAWQFYWDTFRWNLKLGRWKYLAGFPLMAALKR